MCAVPHCTRRVQLAKCCCCIARYLQHTMALVHSTGAHRCYPARLSPCSEVQQYQLQTTAHGYSTPHTPVPPTRPPLFSLSLTLSLAHARALSPSTKPVLNQLPVRFLHAVRNAWLSTIFGRSPGKRRCSSPTSDSVTADPTWRSTSTNSAQHTRRVATERGGRG